MWKTPADSGSCGAVKAPKRDDRQVYESHSYRRNPNQRKQEQMSRGLAMGGHQSAAMVTDTWLTPPHILEALGPFDLDPCAAPDPKPWPTAKVHYTLPTDGLAETWLGRVWLNPPYSREAVKWLRKLASHGTGTALVFARTETSWFVETVWKAATAVLFLHGRLHFHHADGTRAAANAGAPSCLVAYGRFDADQLAECGLDGTFVRLRENLT